MPKTIKKVTRRFRRPRSLKRTLCNSQYLASFEQEIVVKFLETLNTIKLFTGRHTVMQHIKQRMNYTPKLMIM